MKTHENKHTCCHEEKTEAAAVFSSFSSDSISLTEKHMHYTSILLFSVFLYSKFEEPISEFAVGHVGRIRDTQDGEDTWEGSGVWKGLCISATQSV